MSKREIEELEKAMAFVKKHGFEAELAREMMDANKMLVCVCVCVMCVCFCFLCACFISDCIYLFGCIYLCVKKHSFETELTPEMCYFI